MKLIDSHDVPLTQDVDLVIPEKSSSYIIDKKDLMRGESIDATPPLNNEAQVAAVIRTLSGEMPIEGAPDSFTVIDLRGVSSDSGYKLFDGNKFKPDIQFIVLDIKQLDWDKNIGFKGIRAGESFSLGRYQEPTAEQLASMTEDQKRNLAIKRDRFPDMSMWTSRDHFEINCSKEGSLIIKDLNSANGTSVALGESGVGLLAEEEHKNRVTEMVRPLGKAAISETVNSEINTNKSGNNLFLMDSENRLKIKETIIAPSQPEINRKILENFSDLYPNYEVSVDNRNYLISSIFTANGRFHALAFTLVDGQYVPRLFYKSKSEGGWRSCPGMEGSRYSKGEHETEGGYVQVTKPVEELSQKLEKLSENVTLVQQLPNSRVREFLEIFDVDTDEMEKINTFEQEVTVTKIDKRWASGLYDSVEPGIGFKKEANAARREIENISLPPGFEPDFSRGPDRTYNMAHTIAGLTEVQVFSAELMRRPVEWHMARSQSGNIWVESIRFKDIETTSYGTASEVILAGALSAKPFEYDTGVDGMEPGIDYDFVDGEYSSKYVNLQKTWDRIPVIKKYKAYISSRS